VTLSGTSLASATGRPSAARSFSTWDLCAAIAIVCLGLGPLIQISLHRAFESDVAPKIPMDFPHYYVAGRLARLRLPDNLLYFPPVDHKAESYLDLRFDSSTPYGRPPMAGGLPVGAVTLPFDAPPFAALLMAPLTVFGWKAAYAVWQLACALMMLVTAYLSLRLFRRSIPPVLEIAIFLLLALLFEPLQICLRLGNIDVVMVFLWVLGVFLLSRAKIASSAFALALGTFIKLSPIYAVPLFVLRRQWRWLACYTGWCILLSAISVWKLGWHNHVVWVGQVAPALSCGMKSWGNRSLASFVLGFYKASSGFATFPAPKSWCMVNKALSGILYGSFLLQCLRKRDESLIYHLILLPLVILLVSPLSWMQYFVLAFPPLLILWQHSRTQRWRESRITLIALTCSTIIIGAPLPEYRVVTTIGMQFAMLPLGIWVFATAALLIAGMQIFSYAARTESADRV
jgi:hypothetical protein